MNKKMKTLILLTLSLNLTSNLVFAETYTTSNMVGSGNNKKPYKQDPITIVKDEIKTTTTTISKFTDELTRGK